MAFLHLSSEQTQLRFFEGKEGENTHQKGLPEKGKGIFQVSSGFEALDCSLPRHWCVVRTFPEPPTSGISSQISPVQMRGVLRYKWEAYYGTNSNSNSNWRCIAAFPFLQGLEASEARRYKWRAYCGTNWRCTSSTFQTSCTGWGFLNSAQPDRGARNSREAEGRNYTPKAFSALRNQDIFENRYKTPGPTKSQNPPSHKKVPQNPKSSRIPASKRYSPKSIKYF